MTARLANVLVWLPSPLGDAVLSTVALRALREGLPAARLTLLANPNSAALLADSPLADAVWVAQAGLAARIAQLRRGGFTDAILLKNSLGSALTVRLAGIPGRWGYARDGRGWLLTEAVPPRRGSDGRFEPVSMIDYYLDLVQRTGVPAPARRLPELTVSPADQAALAEGLAEWVDSPRPRVVLVPGGAFGPSKCWPVARYAALADALVERWGATVLVSVAPDPAERRIAEAIVSQADASLIDLGRRPLSVGGLKALVQGCDLMVCNDTGPRHLAIALRRPVVSLFGPNDPRWTQTGWSEEIQITGPAPCAPCGRPRCTAAEHFCMEAIGVDQVLAAAETLLNRRPAP